MECSDYLRQVLLVDACRHLSQGHVAACNSQPHGIGDIDIERRVELAGVVFDISCLSAEAESLAAVHRARHHSIDFSLSAVVNGTVEGFQGCVAGLLGVNTKLYLHVSIDAVEDVELSFMCIFCPVYHGKVHLHLQGIAVVGGYLR